MFHLEYQPCARATYEAASHLIRFASEFSIYTSWQGHAIYNNQHYQLKTHKIGFRALAELQATPYAFMPLEIYRN